MKDIIPIVYHDDRLYVSKNKLYSVLGIEAESKYWLSKMREDYGEDNLDFFSTSDESSEEQPKTLDLISLEIAKEICGAQHNEKGKAVRKWLIEVDRSWNSHEKVMARALILAKRQLLSLKSENEKLLFDIKNMWPKVDAYENYLFREGDIHDL